MDDVSEAAPFAVIASSGHAGNGERIVLAAQPGGVAWALLDLGEEWLIDDLRVTVAAPDGATAGLRIDVGTDPADLARLVAAPAMTRPDEGGALTLRHAIGAPMRMIALRCAATAPVELTIRAGGRPRFATIKRGLLDRADRRLYITHNAGLFSILSAALNAVSALSATGDVAARIDLTRGGFLYKARPDDELMDSLFAQQADPTTPLKRLKLQPNGLVHEVDVVRGGPLIARYFTPTRAILDQAERWRDALGIAWQHTLGVYYRGTDKAAEAVRVPPEAYLRRAEAILRENPSLQQVLIQTDEAAVRDLFVAALGSRCRFFPDMAVTSSQTGLHLQGFADPVREAQLMLTAVLCLSRCAALLMGASNVSTWVALYAGRIDQIEQFDRDGTLRRHPAAA